MQRASAGRPLRLSSPGHVFAGLPPGEAGDGSRVSQVNEGEVDLCPRAQVKWGEEFGDVRLPFAGAVPHFHQTVVLQRDRIQMEDDQILVEQ